jgi:uncharacterized membrane protein
VRFVLFVMGCLCLPVNGAMSAGAGAGTVRDRLEIGGKQVPLPEGEWRLAAHAFENVVPALGADGMVEQVVLFRVAAGSVDAFVVVQANAVSGSHGWGLTADCSRSGAALARTVFNGDADGLCVFSFPVTTAPVTAGSEPLVPRMWTAAIDLARAEGWELPARWLMGGIRLSTRSDMIDVRYHFAADPQPGADAGASAAILAEWTAAMAFPVALGVKNHLGEVPAARSPLGGGPAINEAVTPASVARNDMDLRRVPFVTPEKKTDSERAGEGWDARVLSLYKTVTYKLLGVFTGIGTMWAFTGDAFLSTVAYATNQVVSLTLFYFHELIWLNISGLAESGRQRLLELPVPGLAQPS